MSNLMILMVYRLQQYSWELLSNHAFLKYAGSQKFLIDDRAGQGQYSLEKGRKNHVKRIIHTIYALITVTRCLNVKKAKIN